MPHRLAPILALALVMLPRGQATAGGFGIPDIGVRRTAMGSIIGRPDDASAIYHNPAGLILQPGWHLYLSTGLFAVSTEFQLQPWDQSDRLLGTTAGTDGYYAPVRPTRAMGVVPMLAITGELLPGKLVMGAAIYVGNAQGAAFAADAVTRYHLIDGYVVAPQAVLAASYKLTEGLGVGASAGVINVRIHEQRDVFPIVNGSDVSSIIGTKPELALDGSGWAPSWMVAAFGHPIPRLTWGATITGRVDAALEGPIQIAYSDDANTPGDILLGKQSTKQMLPWAFTAGASYDVTPHLEVGVDGRYWLYRQYKTQETDITGIFLVRQIVTVKDYHDSWQLSGGARLHDLTALPGVELMVGTHYDRTPAPSGTVTLDQPTFTHIGLHTGVRWTTGRYRFGASYLHYWYEIPTVTNSITNPAANFRGEGAMNIFTASIEVAL